MEIVGDFNRKDNDYPHTLHKPGKFDGRLYAVIVQEEEDKYSSKRLYIVSNHSIQLIIRKRKVKTDRVEFEFARKLSILYKKICIPF